MPTVPTLFVKLSDYFLFFFFFLVAKKWFAANMEVDRNLFFLFFGNIGKRLLNLWKWTHTLINLRHFQSYKGEFSTVLREKKNRKILVSFRFIVWTGKQLETCFVFKITFESYYMILMCSQYCIFMAILLFICLLILICYSLCFSYSLWIIWIVSNFIFLLT